MLLGYYQTNCSVFCILSVMSFLALLDIIKLNFLVPSGAVSLQCMRNKTKEGKTGVGSIGGSEQRADPHCRICSKQGHKRRGFRCQSHSSTQEGVQAQHSWRRGAAQKKLCFDDIVIRLSKSSAFHRVFPQEEKDAAILLMALSCGLVCSWDRFILEIILFFFLFFSILRCFWACFVWAWDWE